MKFFAIWSEGYRAQGNDSGAVPFGYEEGIDFKDACIRKAEKDPEFKEYFNPDRMTWWGCRLFDNEVDARKSFG